MEYSKTQQLIDADEAAAKALDTLTKATEAPQPRLREDTVVKKAIKRCEATREALMEDLRRQLR